MKRSFKLKNKKDKTVLIEPISFQYSIKKPTAMICPYILEDLSDIDVNDMDMFLVKKR
jgi:hypothetical protein